MKAMAKGATTSTEAAGLNAAGERDGAAEGCQPGGRLTRGVRLPGERDGHGCSVGEGSQRLLSTLRAEEI